MSDFQLYPLKPQINTDYPSNTTIGYNTLPSTTTTTTNEPTKLDKMTHFCSAYFGCEGTTEQERYDARRDVTCYSLINLGATIMCTAPIMFTTSCITSSSTALLVSGAIPVGFCITGTVAGIPGLCATKPESTDTLTASALAGLISSLMYSYVTKHVQTSLA